MGNEHPTAPLSEDQAREAINRWADGGMFRLKNMGDKIFIDQIIPGAAFTLRLQTHYEQRKVRQVSEPFHGGHVDDRGRPPGRWDIAVHKPGRTRPIAISTRSRRRCARSPNFPPPSPRSRARSPAIRSRTSPRP